MNFSGSTKIQEDTTTVALAARHCQWRHCLPHPTSCHVTRGIPGISSVTSPAPGEWRHSWRVCDGSCQRRRRSPVSCVTRCRLERPWLPTPNSTVQVSIYPSMKYNISYIIYRRSGPGPHLVHGYWAQESTTQTTSRSVQPFCRAHQRVQETNWQINYNYTVKFELFQLYWNFINFMMT